MSDNPFLEKMQQRLADLQSQGVMVAETDDTPSCPVCNDMGVIGYDVPYGHPQFGKLHACDNPTCRVAQENRLRAWNLRIKNSRILKGFKHLTLERFMSLSEQQRKGKMAAYWACQLMLRSPQEGFSAADLWTVLGRSNPEANPEPKNWVVFYGPVGTAKTGLMTALAKRLIDGGQQVLVTRFWDMLEEIYRDYKREDGYNFTEHGYALDLFRHAPVLYIDEAVTAKVTEHREDLMEAVIRHRYNDNLTTLFTVNTDIRQFEKIWHERIADIVRTKAHWIYVGGEKLRIAHEPIIE